MQNTFRSFFNSSAIVDFGSAVTKADDSREELPQFLFRSLVGRPKYNRLIGDAAENWVINPDIERLGLYRVSQCIRRGVFQSEDDMRALMSKVYSDLSYNSNKKPLLYSEPLFTSKAIKKRIMKMGFESLETESVLFANQCSLALFAFGKTDGLVVESGDGLTQVGTIYGGYKVDAACAKYELAGSDISAYLRRMLMATEQTLHPTSEFHILNDIKTKMCRVAKSAEEYKEVTWRNQAQLKVQNYLLPDGEQLRLNEEHLLCGELMFQPQVGSVHQPSIVDMIKGAVDALEPEMQSLMLKGVFVSGGNTNMTGFDDRLASELNRGLTANSRRKLLVPKAERSFVVWQGGAVLSNLSSITKMWINLKEFEEQGDRILLIKSF